MRIFVTGGSGFIGTNLIERLAQQGHQILNFDIAPPRNSAHRSYWIKGDIRDSAHLKNVLSVFSPDYVVHLAARTDLNGKSVSDYSTNTDGTYNVVDAISQLATLQRTIFTSSRLVCKIGYVPSSDDDYCPNTYYGESKVIGERLVREWASRIPGTWLITRPTSIWGPWFDTPYKEFFMSVVRGLYFHPAGRQIYKSFGFVGNTCYQIEKLLFVDSEKIHGKTIYLTDYPPIEVGEWAKEIASEFGVRPPLEIPLVVLRGIAAIGDLLKNFGWQNPPLTTFRLNNLLTNMSYPTEDLESICGELPYSLKQGIQLTLTWLQERKIRA